MNPKDPNDDEIVLNADWRSRFNQPQQQSEPTEYERQILEHRAQQQAPQNPAAAQWEYLKKLLGY